MPKRTLIEVNVFAKFLSYFFDKKAKGQGAELDDRIKRWGKSPEAVKAYNAWRTSANDVLFATRDLLLKNKQDTSDIDALIKKYVK
jgi:hypothetical protein